MAKKAATRLATQLSDVGSLDIPECKLIMYRMEIAALLSLLPFVRQLILISVICSRRNRMALAKD
jgi:hypothetical protein